MDFPIRHHTPPMEFPFAWHKEVMYTDEHVLPVPSGSHKPSISFRATRKSKVLGYVPCVGTVVGAKRIYLGIQEYRRFTEEGQIELKQRSLKWVLRGSMEMVPVAGGLSCMAVDLVATKCFSTGSRIGVAKTTPRTSGAGGFG